MYGFYRMRTRRDGPPAGSARPPTVSGMRTLLLHNLPDRLHADVIAPLAAALTTIGCQVETLHVADVTLTLGPDGPVLHDGPRRVEAPDVVLARVVSEPGPARLVAALARSGIRVVNDPAAAAHASDKLVAAVTLARACVPVPEQVYLPRGQGDADALQARLGLPVIVKPPRGMWGDGVELLHTAEQVASRAAPEGRDQGLLAQRFLPEVSDGDVRLLVVDGRTVAAVRRLPAAGEHRANLAKGATVVPHRPTRTERAVAEAAARALELTVAGVDLVPTTTGPYVLEVNPNPGLAATGRTTGVDVFAEVAQAVVCAARA